MGRVWEEYGNSMGRAKYRKKAPLHINISKWFLFLHFSYILFVSAAESPCVSSFQRIFMMLGILGKREENAILIFNLFFLQKHTIFFEYLVKLMKKVLYICARNDTRFLYVFCLLFFIITHGRYPIYETSRTSVNK